MKFQVSIHSFQQWLPTLVLVLVLILFKEDQSVYAQDQKVPKEKILGLSIRINAPIDSVWSRWTTEKGIKKFFAPACRLELQTFGHLDILFAPDAPAGQRGAENNMVLAVQDKKMISFTWDAPPQWPEIRKQRTLVAVRFYRITDTETLVTLTQTGWGIGAEWDVVYDYFGKAWGGFVLPNLKYSLETGPINWKDFPKNAPQGLKPADTFN
jgi:uncharacterized protein YndB with AHSA1/START domain